MGTPAHPKCAGGRSAMWLGKHPTLIVPISRCGLTTPPHYQVKQSGSLFLPIKGSQPHTDELNANSYHLLIILYVPPSAAMHTSHILSHLILMLYLEVETMGISSSEVRKLRHREVKVR